MPEIFELYLFINLHLFKSHQSFYDNLYVSVIEKYFGDEVGIVQFPMGNRIASLFFSTIIKWQN